MHLEIRQVFPHERRVIKLPRRPSEVESAWAPLGSVGAHLVSALLLENIAFYNSQAVVRWKDSSMSRKVLFRSPASHWQPWGSGHDLEKGSATTPTVNAISPATTTPVTANDSTTNSHSNSGSATPNSHPEHHGHHHGRRLRQFVRPNGKKVHICHTPEEHEIVKKKLLEKHPDHDFDLFIHGTPEHVRVSLYPELMFT